MTPKGFPLKTTTSLKTRFAHRFLRSLLQMKKHRPTSSSDQNIIRQSGRKIKMAAFSSMALAVGSRRAWSRALIFKLRCRMRYHGLVRKRWSVAKKKRVIVNKAASQEPSQADKLRRLVPGGETMEFCNLLEETAHYIKCLSTQVQVMQRLADAFST